MPKTNKKTKASKGTGLKKRFDLSNRRVQFFVTIAIVALLGGGWFTYKSFAATATWVMSPSDGTLRGVAQSPCSSKTLTDTFKNGVKVVSLACGTDSASYQKTASALGYKFGQKYSAGTYQVCANVRGTGYFELAFVVNGKTDSSLKQASSSAYSSYCSGFLYSGVEFESFASEVKIIGNNNPQFPTLINVSNITLKRISASADDGGTQANK